MALPPEPWPTGVAEQCEPLVRRVLAPNPSPYTYTGTQTYIVGNAGDVAVIDPGPADEAHLDAVVRAIGGARVVAIMCTHTHRDHSPAAAPLSARTGAPVVGCAPLVLESDLPRSDESFDS
ncbi:MAG TPA: MBL fold metallo-hydrolase, partial [Erythrobacter sp.]|nr:MBL fold metallo-hydrolase [Erythrobacter sp.]